MSLDGIAPVSNMLSENYRYTYDNNGNIIESSRYWSSIGLWGNQTKYEYDAQNQLIVERTNNNAIRYTYSPTGNIVSKSTYLIDNIDDELNDSNLASVRYYSYDNSNWKDLLTSYNNKPITYDEIGNPLTYDGNTYEWTQGRRLKGITNSSKTISYQYNSDGIRTSKTVNGVTTDYVLEGSNIIYQTDGTNQLWFSDDPNDRVTSFTVKQGNATPQTYYYTRNVQGDITGFYDTSGNMVCTYFYDTWGNYSGAFGNNTLANLNPFRYRGYYYDAETGYYYLNARYYNAEWGRFLNCDGQLAFGQDTEGANLFAYCSNNPVNRLDPSGKAWYHWVLGAVVVAACAVAVVATAGCAIGAIGAIGAVCSGVAASTTASTVAAAAFVASATVYGLAVVDAAVTSKSVKEFNSKGNWGTVAKTTGAAILGGLSGYVAGKSSSIPVTRSTSKPPKNSIPNSIYFQYDNSNTSKIRSVTYYGNNGNWTYRDDYMHSHYIDGVRYCPHRHIAPLLNNNGEPIGRETVIPLFPE